MPTSATAPTWLNGTAVTGTTTNMPAWPALVRIAAFTAGNVNANTLGRDRTIRYGGMQPGEVMVFNTVLTTQQQTDIDAYLAKKWSNTGTGIGNRLPDPYQSDALERRHPRSLRHQFPDHRQTGCQ